MFPLFITPKPDLDTYLIISIVDVKYTDNNVILYRSVIINLSTVNDLVLPPPGLMTR